MKLIVCAVKDSAVQAFARPIFVPSAGLAVRSFSDEVKRSAADNQMYQHPDDFELYQLASWDEESGAFVNEDVPLCLARGKYVSRPD